MKSNISKKISVLVTILYTLIPFVIIQAQELNSSNFKIKGDSVSSGSVKGDSNNYKMSGEINPLQGYGDSSNYKYLAGYNPRITANTPAAPDLSNPSEYYNKLKIIINTSNNPSDTLYAIAISSDNWTTTYYVQSDGTVGSVLGLEDYRTYVSLGGASGTTILGLNPNTSYKSKVKALNGDFTETDYSPDSEQATTDVPFVKLTNSTNNVSFAALSTNAVSATSSVTLTINTNAESGYQLYIKGTGNGVNGGLYNGTNLISSNDAALVAGAEGYGAQGSSSTATIATKYNVTSNEVGALPLTNQNLASNTSPVSSETVNVTFKAAISATTKAGSYGDTIYYTITPNL